MTDTVLTLPSVHQTEALNRMSARCPVPESPDQVFADWINATRALLGWNIETLASIRVTIDGATCGGVAALRKVAHEIHDRRIEINNLNRK